WSGSAPCPPPDRRAAPRPRGRARPRGHRRSPGRGRDRGPRPPPAPRPAAHRRSPGTAPRSRRSRRCLPSSRALRSATGGGRGGGAVLAVGQLGAASGPDHAALDEGAHVLVLEHLDPVAGGGHEDAAFAPLAGPDRGGGDLAVPRVPL